MAEFPKEVKEFAEKEYKEWAGAEGLSDDEKKVKFGRAVRVTEKYLPRLRKELKSGDLVGFPTRRRLGAG